MHPYLNIAVRAARLAGTIITRHLEQLDSSKIFEKGLNDFVTIVDKSAEEAIIDTIYKAYPHHGILAEETGEHPGNEYVWVIDPLDGTMNYVHGFPQFAVSIAVKYKGQLEHGVIYDPISQDLYTATRGAGAQVNNRRIRASNLLSLENALIGMAFPFQHRQRNMEYSKDPRWSQHLEILRTVQARCSDTRKVGCASLNLAYVAAGRLDGYWEPGLKEWDIAAGALIAREAGAFVSDFNGEANYLDNGDIIAGGRKIHQELLQIIQKGSEVLK
jgi:myo-inositol-1(or 4)-monophosphatase